MTKHPGPSVRAPRAAAAHLVLLLGAAAQAADGRIPVYQPTTITAPGVYYLTRDIVGPASSPAINIVSDDVTLDLHGHTIYPGAGGTGVQSSTVPGRSGLHVTNGRIVGGRVGVLLNGLEGGVAVVDRLAVSDQQGGGSVAIWVTMNAASVGEVRIHDNTIANVTGLSATGINVWNARSGSIRGNDVVGVANYGLYVYQSTRVVIEGNVLGEMGEFGIQLASSSACRITGNTVGPGYAGIRLSTANRNSIDWNVVSDCTYKGVDVLPGCTGNIYSYNRLLGNPSNDFGIGNTSAGGNNSGGANF